VAKLKVFERRRFMMKPILERGRVGGLLVILFVVSFLGASSILAQGYNTNTYHFTYNSRTELLADGWDFIARQWDGGPRDTEITDSEEGALVSYDQGEHPGVLRIPADVGDLYQYLNNTRNSIFRDLPTNWASVRLELSFTPTNNFQQANLAIYDNDDSYVSVVHVFNVGERITMTREFRGGLLHYLEAGQALISSSHIHLRIDRDQYDRLTGFYSLDGNDWIAVGSLSQAFESPRLAIIVGGSNEGSPNVDIHKVDVITVQTFDPPRLVLQPRQIVFNAVAGQSNTNRQQLRVTIDRDYLPAANWTLTNTASWLLTSITNGSTPDSADLSVDTSGLLPGVYETVIACEAPGAVGTNARVTLIINPAERVQIAPWKGGLRGAMSLSVDDGDPSGFADLYAHGLRGTYVMNGDVAPNYYTEYYEAGMELGSHTITHVCGPLPDGTLRGEIEGNVAGLLATSPATEAEVISFVWPCGYTSIKAQSVAYDYFLSARGYNINELEDSSPYNLMNLKSFNSHEHTPFPPEDLKTQVDAAIAEGKWFNLVLHQFNNHDEAVQYSVGKDIWVDTIGAVTKYIVQRDRTVFLNYQEGPEVVKFDFYRLPLDATPLRNFETVLSTNDVLTFKLNVSGLPSVTRVRVNGEDVSVTARDGFLYWNSLVTTNIQSVELDLGENAIPVLSTVSNQIVDEMMTLTVTNTADDADLPYQSLSYVLIVTNSEGVIQNNAQISANGIISWTPTETQGPGVYTFITVVTDTAWPPGRDTNVFTVTVNEINQAPVLPVKSDFTVIGAGPFSITNTAVDSDLPVNALNYSLIATNVLDGSVVDAHIDTNGVITWSPSSDQLPATIRFTTVVTDTNVMAVNAQNLSATNTFTMTVLTNLIALPSVENQFVNELSPLIVNMAGHIVIDSPEIITNTVLFDYPDRMAFLADGWSFWATNNGVGRNTEVLDTNPESVQYAQNNGTLGTVLRLPCDTGDLWDDLNDTKNSIFRDLPTNWMSLRLTLSFAPTQDFQQAQIGLYQDDDNYIQVGVFYSSFGNPFGSSKYRVVSFTSESMGEGAIVANSDEITESELVLRLDRNLENGEIIAMYSSDGEEWVVLGTTSQTLTDARLGIWAGGAINPYASTLLACDLSRLDIVTWNSVPSVTYALTVTNIHDDSEVDNANIDENGVITWIPTEAQGPGTYLFTTVASVQGYTNIGTFMATVYEINVAPELTLPNDVIISPLSNWTAQATASDVDIPSNSIMYALVSGPSGLTVSPAGLISWTPGVDQAGTTNDVIISVTDSNSAAINNKFLSAAGGFKVVVAPAPTMVWITANNTNRVYGDANPQFTGSVVGLSPEDEMDVTVTYTTTADGSSPVGAYPIIPVVQDPNNKLSSYTLIVTNNGVLTVTPRAASVTVNVASKTYGQAVTFTGTEFTTSGFINGDVVNSVTLTSAGAVATADVSGSPYAITASDAIGSGISNYTISYIPGVLTVNQAPLTVSGLTGDNKSYDATTAATVSGTATLSGVVNDDEVILEGTPVFSFAQAMVGTDIEITTVGFTLGGADADNYILIQPTLNADITAKSLTIKADDKYKVYGQADPLWTVSYDGFVLGEGVEVLDGNLDVSRVPGEAVGEYVITPSGQTSVNYSINYVTGKLTIVSAPVLVNIVETPPKSGNFTITWRVVKGRTYRFEWNSDLRNPEWTPVLIDGQVDYIATDDLVVVNHELGINAGKGFYRVLDVTNP